MPGKPGAGPCTRRHRGFTLLEVLVAMTVLSLILVALYAALRVTVRGWDGGESLVRESEMLRTSNEFLRRYLQQAYPLLRWKDRVWRLEFSGDGDQLRLVTAMPPRLGVGGLYELHITTEKRAGGVALLLHRRLLHPDIEDRADDDLPPGIVDDSVLAEGLREVKFDYFGVTGTNAPPDWQERWKDQKRLPGLVRMRAIDGHGAPWPELTVALHIDGVRRIRALAPPLAPANPSPPGAAPGTAMPMAPPGTPVPGATPNTIPGMAAPRPGAPPT